MTFWFTLLLCAHSLAHDTVLTEVAVGASSSSLWLECTGLSVPVSCLSLLSNLHSRTRDYCTCGVELSFSKWCVDFPKGIVHKDLQQHSIKYLLYLFYVLKKNLIYLFIILKSEIKLMWTKLYYTSIFQQKKKKSFKNNFQCYFFHNYMLLLKPSL